MIPALKARISLDLGDDGAWDLDVASVDEDPDRQTVLFRYPTAFSERADYIRPVVKIEFGARSETEFAEEAEIRPHISDAFPEVVRSGAFRVRALSPRRTFWEKAMLLHEESHRPSEKRRKARLARHYYDLWRLIEKGVGREAARDQELFERVAKHRRAFFRYGWMDYSTLTPGRLRLVPPPDQLEAWRSDYQAMQQEMFYGDRPTFAAVMESVRHFEIGFNQQ